MKTKTTLVRTIAVFAMFMLFNCNKNPKASENLLSASNVDSASGKQDPLVDVPMPAKLDSAMRQSFDKETYQELKKLSKKNVKSFFITKENYSKMIDDLPVGADRVSFNFVQFNSTKFPGKYKGLSKFDGSLYMLYSYIDKNGKNLTDKNYAILSVKDAVEVSEIDFKVMAEDYVNNIKSKIDRFVKGTQGNTLSVRISREDLEAYKARMTTKKDIGKFKITLAQWVVFDNFLTKGQSSALSKKLSYFADENVGQMTFITDCVGTNGQNIEDLSGDDMNVLCPNICDQHMNSLLLSNIYNIVVIINMLYSLYLLFWKKYAERQRYFYLYISFVFFVDVLGLYIRRYFHVGQIYLYFPLFIFTISYFAYFFGKDYKDKVNKTILYLLTFIAFILLFVFQIKNDKLLVISTTTILVVILYQLILCLQWFWYIVNHADEQNIIHKQAFWVSCALLIWSTFALFRMYPMYDLIKIDSAFLSTIIDVFQVVNIITYLLYIRGLRCTDYNILRTFNHF